MSDIQTSLDEAMAPFISDVLAKQSMWSGLAGTRGDSVVGESVTVRETVTGSDEFTGSQQGPAPAPPEAMGETMEVQLCVGGEPKTFLFYTAGEVLP